MGRHTATQRVQQHGQPVVGHVGPPLGLQAPDILEGNVATACLLALFVCKPLLCGASQG